MSQRNRLAAGAGQRVIGGANAIIVDSASLPELNRLRLSDTDHDFEPSKAHPASRRLLLAGATSDQIGKQPPQAISSDRCSSSRAHTPGQPPARERESRSRAQQQQVDPNSDLGRGFDARRRMLADQQQQSGAESSAGLHHERVSANHHHHNHQHLQRAAPQLVAPAVIVANRPAYSQPPPPHHHQYQGQYQHQDSAPLVHPYHSGPQLQSGFAYDGGAGHFYPSGQHQGHYEPHGAFYAPVVEPPPPPPPPHQFHQSSFMDVEPCEPYAARLTDLDAVNSSGGAYQSSEPLPEPVIRANAKIQQEQQRQQQLRTSSASGDAIVSSGPHRRQSSDNYLNDSSASYIDVGGLSGAHSSQLDQFEQSAASHQHRLVGRADELSLSNAMMSNATTASTRTINVCGDDSFVAAGESALFSRQVGAYAECQHQEMQPQQQQQHQQQAHVELDCETDYGLRAQDNQSDANSDSELKYCEWEGCGNTFLNMADFVKHLEERHVNLEPRERNRYFCLWSNCKRNEQDFNARYKLLIHMRVHSGEKPFACEEEKCKKSFSRLENLKIHVRSHTGEKPYKCNYDNCTKSFTNSSDRIKHHKTHKDPKPYTCTQENCGKRYTDPSSLRKHLRSHQRAASSAGAASSYAYSQPQQVPVAYQSALAAAQLQPLSSDFDPEILLKDLDAHHHQSEFSRPVACPSSHRGRYAHPPALPSQSWSAGYTPGPRRQPYPTRPRPLAESGAGAPQSQWAPPPPPSSYQEPSGEQFVLQDGGGDEHYYQEQHELLGRSMPHAGFRSWAASGGARYVSDRGGRADI